MPKRSVPYNEALFPMLKDDPELAMAYLNECLEDDDPRIFLLAFKDVAEARGLTIKEIADKTGFNRETLYRTLSKKGNPEWKTLKALLNVLGLKLTVEKAGTG